MADIHTNEPNGTSSSTEPKSIHTWLDSDKSNIYNYDVDLCITAFPSQPEIDWLYFYGFYVNFIEHKEWAHGGLQYANPVEFRNNHNQGVNWGGGGDDGYGHRGVNKIPYTWELNKWYRYRIWRLPKDNEGLWHWGFWIKDYESGEDKQFGIVKMNSAYIRNASVWIETGYGVSCDTERTYVKWRNPLFRCGDPGEFIPNKGMATYNGNCEGLHNTNQGLISEDPYLWFQATNMERTTANYVNLWGG